MSLYLPGTVLFTKIPDFMSYLMDASLVHQVCQRLGGKTYIVIESIAIIDANLQLFENYRKLLP